ncbi:MAG: hypothetical protein ACREV6_22800 [Clostridium sp.]|uniref:hypothetical protein n=1 Tax=Clostridium sp. TaxID=1506 RepID=UPI003D6D6B17
MSSNKGVPVKVEVMQKIIKELSEISHLCSEPHLKMKIEGLQSYVSSVFDLGSKRSVEDEIFEKMVEVKQLNPDLHTKLYMLYRNLMSGRISELDAMDSFENCLSMFPLDVMVY